MNRNESHSWIICVDICKFFLTLVSSDSIVFCILYHTRINERYNYWFRISSWNSLGYVYLDEIATFARAQC